MSYIVVLNDGVHHSCSLIERLKQAGHQVTSFTDQGNTLDYLQQMNIDVLVCERYQFTVQKMLLMAMICEHFALPIISLVDDDLDGLNDVEAGADYYILQSNVDKSLLIHISALLRRVALTKKRLAFQHCSESFSLRMSKLPLTKTEMQLTQFLSHHNGKIVSKATLQKEVLKKELSLFDRNLDMHISNIRRKMVKAKLSKSHIQTVHGKGYLFSEHIS